MLAEDANMVRGALVALLALEPDFDIVAEVSRGDVILPTALECRPDVAVIDVDLPGKNGIAAAAELREQLPTCRTLILTSMGRPGTLRRALEARVGAFILKDAPSHELAATIRSVHGGKRVIDSSLALAAWDSAECPLTARELEVLQLAANGAQTSEIASEVCLSAGTVRNYLTTATMKLNARNRVDAIRIARDAGWF